jgi:hypothetical protein
MLAHPALRRSSADSLTEAELALADGVRALSTAWRCGRPG